jgi:hypothetical protein
MTLSKVEVNPTLKVIPSTRFINGKFTSSMTIEGDIAVATLTDEVELSDTLFPICLPDKKYEASSLIVGEFSGWSVQFKAIEDFNSTFTKNSEDEFHEIRPNEKVDFAEGKQISFYLSH